MLDFAAARKFFLNLAGIWILIFCAGFIIAAQNSAFAKPLSIFAPKIVKKKHAPDDLRQPVGELLKNYNADKAWVEFNDGQKVWAYADQHSIKAGEPITIFASTKPKSEALVGTIKIVRVSGKDNKLDFQDVFQVPNVKVESQLMLPDSSTIGTDWNNGSVITKTANWKSGFYIVNFAYADGKVDPSVAWFVVRPTDKWGDILFKVPTNTVQAYNPWGGSSLYQTASYGSLSALVSFDRPSAMPLSKDVYYAIAWMETYAAKKNLKVDYIADFDLSDDPSILDGYKLFVTGGHDEYWTKEMYDAVEDRIFNKGGNVLFLGGNIAYFQVRYIDVNQPLGGTFWGRQMLCHKPFANDIDPIAARAGSPELAKLLTTGQFRFGKRRPETMLMGVAYQSWFEGHKPASSYSVVDNDLPFFKDTGLKVGDQLPRIVGYEWDNRNPDADGNRVWDPKISLNKEIPKSDVRVLFNARPRDYEKKRGLAEAVYWRSAKGAKIFSAGTIWWSWGMAKPGVANAASMKFNENLFDYFLR